MAFIFAGLFCFVVGAFLLIGAPLFIYNNLTGKRVTMWRVVKHFSKKKGT